MNSYLPNATECILFGQFSVLGILQLDRAQGHESLSKKLLLRTQQGLSSYTELSSSLGFGLFILSYCYFDILHSEPQFLYLEMRE